MYVFTVYFRGLMERVDEMNMKILQIQSNDKDRIQMPLPQQQVPFPRQPLRQPHPIQPQQRAAKPHPYQPHPAQQQVPQSHISRQPWLPTCLCV